ncbi:MAG: rhomboid family intramembrane serine protease [Enhygromyxa sp.]
MSDEDQVISLAEKRAQAQAAAAEAAREQARQQARRPEGPTPNPWVTWNLIGLNVLIWVAMVGFGVDAFEPSVEALLSWGGNLGLLTQSGQWWRLLTAMFLHAGIIHLAFNCYFAWVIGRICEQVFGAAAYVLVYFGSGLFASLVSVAWQPASVSVGASGALFGVFGAFLGFTIRRREILPPEFVKSVRRNALILIGINLVIGFAVPGIDVAAHVGGLVAGLGIGYSIARLAEKPVGSRQEAKAVRARAIGLTALATAAILLAGALGLPRYDNPMPVLDHNLTRHDEVIGRYEDTREAEARIELLEREVIPMLREGEAELAALERVPARFGEVVEAYERYFGLQVRAYERELEGLRAGDPVAIAEAESLHAEAIELLR